MSEPKWKHDGVAVVPGNALDTNTPQTPGMNRAAAIDFARAGAQKLWAGTVTIHANARTGAHHHGHLESVIYVVKGKARMRWGESLEFVAEAGPGDFIFVPPYVPHQEINASPDEAAGMRAGALRWSGNCGQSGHRTCRKARKREMDRPRPPRLAEFIAALLHRTKYPLYPAHGHSFRPFRRIPAVSAPPALPRRPDATVRFRTGSNPPQ